MSPGSPGPRSRRLFRRAERSLVGGVDSPVRAYRSVGGTPPFIARARGAVIEDVDGRRYLDLVNSWGANVLGAAVPEVVAAVRSAAREGLSFGAPSPREHELAERIRAAVPEMGLLRFVSSGTEATASAVRVARGFTRRPLVVKFAGGYHGHADGLLARAGSGIATGALPDSAGVPPATVRSTRVLPYNDSDALDRLFERDGERIAAVIVEPVAGNMGLVPPVPGFLPRIGAWCRRSGALAIADEVITGFRLRRGIIAPTLGLTPDLVALGKIIGGGFPVAAYGGRRKVLEMVAPLGPVYKSGSLSGNPVGMAAGAATLDRLDGAVYAALERSGRAVAEGMEAAAEERGVAPIAVQRVGSMIGLFFAPGPVRSFDEARRTDAARYARFFHAALDAGIYLPPSPFETLFTSAAYGPRECNRAVAGLARALAAVGAGRR